ncbi:hypothetical protein HDU76_006210, partial [Blyttiomyces sp. JEL0837]
MPTSNTSSRLESISIDEIETSLVDVNEIVNIADQLLRVHEAGPSQQRGNNHPNQSMDLNTLRTKQRTLLRRVVPEWSKNLRANRKVLELVRVTEAKYMEGG